MTFTIDTGRLTKELSPLMLNVQGLRGAGIGRRLRSERRYADRNEASVDSTRLQRPEMKRSSLSLVPSP